MTPFLAFMLWLGAIWLLVALKAEPLQPDQLTDDLGDLDMTTRERRIVLAEAAWWENPVINIRLSGRWLK